MESQLTIQELSVIGLGPINLSVAAGDCVAISGPSGEGKSIFLRAIADLIPHEGRVCLGSVDCDNTKAHVWRQQVSYLHAESQWWADVVGHHFEDDVSSLLVQLGLDRAILEQPLSRCSSGEKQRLALIRLLIQEPKALLLDEPTASLDPDSVAKVEAIIKAYRTEHQVPVIWVSHDPAQRERIAEQHYVIRDKRLARVMP